jgi:DNA-directed RNA polymerase subunit RPC12/RpoP
MIIQHIEQINIIIFSISMSNYKKVTCVDCKNEFDSNFQGKNPKCKSCIEQTKNNNENYTPTSTTSTTSTTLPTMTTLKKLTCVECKQDFNSNFQGKNPKCKKCTQIKKTHQPTSESNNNQYNTNETIHQTPLRNVTCVGCKKEFTSNFLGKNPKCKQC